MDPLRELVLPLLDGVRLSGGVYSARCPAHEDTHASLSVSVGRDQPVVFHCHAGCHPEDIVARLGLSWADISAPREHSGEGESIAGSPIVATYDYRDENGVLLFQVVRTANKDFRQRVPDDTAKGGWGYRLGDTRRVLYRLPELLTHPLPDTIWVCEGEKDVHALVTAGVHATCNPGGAGKWQPAYNDVFAGANVVIVADRDEPGALHARRVYDELLPVAAQVKIVEAKTGKDAADHLAAGHGIDEFNQVWPRPLPAVELTKFLNADEPEHDWLIPGLLEKGDRLILTGQEGKGKSTLMRQIAVQVASGIHPFDLGRIDRAKVLYLDLENPERLVRRAFAGLYAAAGAAYETIPGLHICLRPDGIDLLKADDAQWLHDLVVAVGPALFITGPLYKLAGGDPTEEVTARAATAALDRVRKAVGCTLILEAHTPYGTAGKDGKRPERPYGASLWSRWPEFGMFLSPDGELRHWRTPRDERDWPVMLKRGGEWPWTVEARVVEVRWVSIVAIVRQMGGKPSVNKLADMLGEARANVRRAVEAHQPEWDGFPTLPRQVRD